jgi:GxxExxY protein
MTENEISELVIGICIRVHKFLGPGLFESVYEAAICLELVRAGLRFTTQQEIDAIYNGTKLNVSFRADIIVEEKVIIEIKSIDSIAPVHKKQVITYLKLSGLKLGLLINFNVNLLKEGIFRLVNNL